MGKRKQIYLAADGLVTVKCTSVCSVQNKESLEALVQAGKEKKAFKCLASVQQWSTMQLGRPQCLQGGRKSSDSFVVSIDVSLLSVTNPSLPAKNSTCFLPAVDRWFLPRLIVSCMDQLDLDLIFSAIRFSFYRPPLCGLAAVCLCSHDDYFNRRTK